MCDAIKLTVPAHSIGATDPEEAATIDAQLDRCPDAAAEFAAYQAMAERLLYSAPPANPSPQLGERLRAAIALESAAASSPFTAVHTAGERAPRPGNPLLRRQSAAEDGAPNAVQHPLPTNAMPAQPLRTLPFGGKPRAATARRTMRARQARQAPVSPLPPAMAMYRLQSNPAQFSATGGYTQRRAAPTASTLRNPWHFGRFLATAAVLALVFINMALLGQNQQLRREQQTIATYLSQQNQALILLAAEAPHEIEIFAPDGESRAKADILWNNDLGVAVVYVRNFPQCDPGMKYQLWLTKSGVRTSGGLFSVDSSGMGLLVMPVEHSLDLYDSIGITPEPDGGSPGPTAPPIVRGEI
ncbi:MAG: anti-sigma factor [Caldilineaceae bacterium]|nr:anti-sigma factor [Caldilineaceae bacterium]